MGSNFFARKILLGGAYWPYAAIASCSRIVRFAPKCGHCAPTVAC